MALGAANDKDSKIHLNVYEFQPRSFYRKRSSRQPGQKQRREGGNIYYQVADPCVRVLLERGVCLIECCPEEGE